MTFLGNWQVNEALSDAPSGQLDHSMRVELDQVLHVGQRITLCMARCASNPPGSNALCSIIVRLLRSSYITRLRLSFNVSFK